MTQTYNRYLWFFEPCSAAKILYTYTVHSSYKNQQILFNKTGHHACPYLSTSVLAESSLKKCPKVSLSRHRSLMARAVLLVSFLECTNISTWFFPACSMTFSYTMSFITWNCKNSSVIKGKVAWKQHHNIARLRFKSKLSSDSFG